MNGYAVPELGGRPVNIETVKLLEALLDQARAGQVVSVAAAYSFGPGHVQMTMNTAHPLELNLGCDMLKATLLKYMTTPQQPSKILRAMPGG